MEIMIFQGSTVALFGLWELLSSEGVVVIGTSAPPGLEREYILNTYFTFMAGATSRLPPPARKMKQERGTKSEQGKSLS